jgi:sugar/nucleoside kinase (ribokinase family)
MPSDPPLLAPRDDAARFDVVGLGEISVDLVARVDRWPRVGDKVGIDEMAEMPGGQIATATLGCARLGLRTALIGAVGRERAGKIALRLLDEADVELGGVRRVKGARTRSAHVYVRRSDGERSVLWHRTPELDLKIGRKRERLIQSGRLLMTDTTDLNATRHAIDCARAAGVPVMIDADGLFAGWETLLADVDFPVVSRHFADECGQSRDPRVCLDTLVRLGARAAVVTLGERGAIGRFGERVIEEPAFRVDVRDTTGAGDAFHAGFAWSLLGGLSPEACLRTSNAVAALACEGVGAQSGLPTADRVRALLAAESS